MKFFNKQSPSVPSRRERMSEEVSGRRLFRRNQTLTGSSSSRITSPGEHGAHLKSPRVHVHALASARRRVGALLTTTLFAALGLYFLLAQLTARVEVTLHGLARTDNHALISRYEPLIQDYFARHTEERLRFLANTSMLAQHVQEKAPEVKSISIEQGADMGTSQFILNVRRPVAGWLVNGKQEYVDSTGVAFTHNYYAQPGVQIVDKSGVPTTGGHAIASHRFLGFIGRLVGLTEIKGYHVTHVILPTATARQVEVRIKETTYPIRCSVDRAAGEQAEDIDRVVRYLRQKGIQPAYVDVRVQGKAFYQ